MPHDSANNYFNLVRTIMPPISRNPDKAALVQLDGVRDNLITTLRDTPGVPGLELAVNLWRYWLAKSCFKEGQEWLIRKLADIREPIPPALRGEALRGLGVLTGRLSEYGQARIYLMESLSVWSGIGDKVGEAGTLNSLGTLAQDEGFHEQARLFYERSLEIWRLTEDEWGIASTLNNLGMLEYGMGELNTAFNYLFESARIYRTIENSQELTAVLNNLGSIACEREDFTRAQSYYEESLGRLQYLGNRSGVAIVMHNLGECLFRQGDLANAALFLRDSIKLRHTLKFYKGIALPVVSLANIECSRQQFQNAAVLFGAAETLRKSYGPPIRPIEQEGYDDSIDQVRNGLGVSSFENYRRLGIELPIDDLVAYLTENR